MRIVGSHSLHPAEERTAARLPGQKHYVSVRSAEVSAAKRETGRTGCAEERKAGTQCYAGCTIVALSGLCGLALPSSAPDAAALWPLQKHNHHEVNI